jgi:hypothetical protein
MILGYIAFLLIAAVPGWTQDLVLFRGDPEASAGYTVGGWGSGTAQESKEIVYAGDVALKFTTRNLFTGMRIDFGQPVDISSMMANKNAYIQFTVRSTTLSEGAQGTGTSGAPGSPPRGPGLVGSGSGSGKGGGGGGAAQFAEQVLLLPQYYISPITQIRTILFFPDGVLSVDSQLVELFKVNEDGWAHCWVPLGTFRGNGAISDYRLKRVVLCGNARDTLYLGDARIVIDDEPIHAYGGDTYVVPTDSVVWLQARADGGAAALSYSWDFDASDGITQDATGYIVSHTYTKTGKYTVTLTVSDLNGIKAPVQVTYTVEATV